MGPLPQPHCSNTATLVHAPHVTQSMREFLQRFVGSTLELSCQFVERVCRGSVRFANLGLGQCLSDDFEKLGGCQTNATHLPRSFPFCFQFAQLGLERISLGPVFEQAKKLGWRILETGKDRADNGLGNPFIG